MKAQTTLPGARHRHRREAPPQRLFGRPQLLMRQAEPLQQSPETRFGAQPIEPRIHAEGRDYPIASIKSSLAPVEHRIGIHWPGVQERKGQWGDISICRPSLQLPEDRLGLVLIVSPCPSKTRRQAPLSTSQSLISREQEMA